MPEFTIRSYEPEMMDAPNVDTTMLHQNLRELETINALTGGPDLTFAALKQLVSSVSRDEITVVDVGYGAGDFLSYMVRKKNQLACKINLIGVDYSQDVKAYIDKYHPELKEHVTFVTSDYRDYFRQAPPVDVVTASLFCHHLNDDELSEFLLYIKKYATVGAVINDLHRHPVAYYGIKWLTRWFSSSVFTRNDAPLSVLRGFKKHEWQHTLSKAGIQKAQVSWRWAFRHLITIKNG